MNKQMIELFYISPLEIAARNQETYRMISS